MTNLQKNNYFILTGAMGAGKSTILKGLRNIGITCIDDKKEFHWLPYEKSLGMTD